MHFLHNLRNIINKSIGIVVFFCFLVDRKPIGNCWLHFEKYYFACYDQHFSIIFKISGKRILNFRQKYLGKFSIENLLHKMSQAEALHGREKPRKSYHHNIGKYCWGGCKYRNFMSTSCSFICNWTFLTTLKPIGVLRKTIEFHNFVVFIGKLQELPFSKCDGNGC